LGDFFVDGGDNLLIAVFAGAAAPGRPLFQDEKSASIAK